MLRQQLKKDYDSLLALAKDYYSMLFTLGGIKIRPKELEMVAFSAVKGTLSTPPVKDEFIKTFKISNASYYNLISSLKKKKILIKVQKKLRLNPNISLDFSKVPLQLNIDLRVI